MEGRKSLNVIVMFLGFERQKPMDQDLNIRSKKQQQQQQRTFPLSS